MYHSGSHTHYSLANPKHLHYMNYSHTYFVLAGIERHIFAMYHIYLVCYQPMVPVLSFVVFFQNRGLQIVFHLLGLL